MCYILYSHNKVRFRKENPRKHKRKHTVFIEKEIHLSVDPGSLNLCRSRVSCIKMRLPPSFVAQYCAVLVFSNPLTSFFLGYFKTNPKHHVIAPIKTSLCFSSKRTWSLILVSNCAQNSTSGPNLPSIQLLGKKEPSTYPERSLVIHGSIRVSKLPDKHPLKPALQDGWDSEPLQWELWNEWQRGQVRSTRGTGGLTETALHGISLKGKPVFRPLSSPLQEIAHLRTSVIFGQSSWHSCFCLKVQISGRSEEGHTQVRFASMKAHLTLKFRQQGLQTKFASMCDA